MVNNNLHSSAGICSHLYPSLIKKMDTKIKYEQFEYTGMKINNHFLICGGIGTGKTDALYSYLLETSKPKNGAFKHIFVVYKTEEPLYEDL
jgi:hypothetical protein